MRFTIYQAPFEQTAWGYDPAADYAPVWEGELDAARYRRTALQPEEDVSDLLDAIWTDFQRVDEEVGPWPPEGYEGRSLSVGDVVLLDGWAAFSIDLVGFSMKPGFLQPALAGRRT